LLAQNKELKKRHPAVPILKITGDLYYCGVTQAGSASLLAISRDAHWDRMELYFYNS